MLAASSSMPLFISSGAPDAEELARHGIVAVLVLAPPLRAGGHARGPALGGAEALPAERLMVVADGTDAMLRLLPRCFSFIKKGLHKAQGPVLIAALEPTSQSFASAVLIGWRMCYGERDSFASSLEAISVIHAQVFGGRGRLSLPASWKQDLRHLERAAKGSDLAAATWKSIPCTIAGLPTLSFAPQFEQPVLDGTKGATTRLMRGPDKLAGVSRVGSICAACIRGRRFGLLKILRTRDLTFAELDEETARIEDLASPAALQGVLRGFYPDIRDDDVVRVVYYSPLVALPPMAEGPKRHASEVLSILGCSAAALTAVEIVALAGGDLTRQNVNSALYQLVRQGAIARSGTQGKSRPLWQIESGPTATEGRKPQTDALAAPEAPPSSTSAPPRRSPLVSQARPAGRHMRLKEEALGDETVATRAAAVWQPKKRRRNVSTGRLSCS